MQNEPQKLVPEKIRGSDDGGWSARTLRVVEGVGNRLYGDLVGEYLGTLGGRSPATVEAYSQDLAATRGVDSGAALRMGHMAFRPELLTRTAVEGFLSELEMRGHGTSHRLRTKSAISGFAIWLVEEKGLLRRNPTRGVEIPAQPLLAPRRLSPDQRYVLKNLVERDGAVRSAAIFALGYWAGCRVSGRLVAHGRERPCGSEGRVAQGRTQGWEGQRHRPRQRGAAGRSTSISITAAGIWRAPMSLPPNARRDSRRRASTTGSGSCARRPPKTSGS